MYSICEDEIEPATTNHRTETKLKAQKSSQSFYEIQVEGDLGDMWAAWFAGLSIRKEVNRASQCQVTVFSGPIPDQPALFGVLNKIRDLNLELLSIKKYEQKGDNQ